MIILRQALVDEWPSVANITQIANDEYKQVADSQFWSDYEERTRSMLLTEMGVVRLVASEGDELMGSVVYCPPYERQMAGKTIKNPYPEMRLLSVLPGRRNQGIGAQLIQACEDRAKAERAEAITLHTTDLMSTARAMYERRGYSRYTAIDFEPAPGFIVYGYIKHPLV